MFCFNFGMSHSSKELGMCCAPKGLGGPAGIANMVTIGEDRWQSQRKSASTHLHVLTIPDVFLHHLYKIVGQHHAVLR
jgi:hypothetical protein